MKNVIINILKIALAISLITWLLRSGKLDFNLINQSFHHGYFWLICILLLIIQAIFAAFRWSLLISVQSSKKIPLLQIIKVSWIGMFFNSMLPGAVTGDLIKLIYAKDLDPKLQKTFLITSVLLDRILGLIGLLTILGLACLLFYSELIHISVEFKHLIHFNLLMFIAGMSFLSLLFLPKSLQEKILNLINLIPTLGQKISKVVHSFWILGENKTILIQTYLLSILVQSMNIVAFWVITHPFFSHSVEFKHLFAFIPSGLIAVAIPVAPGGIGVGHLVFDKLFSYMNIEQGASLFNLYFLCAIFVNLLGVIPYLLSGKKHKLIETENFN